MKEHFQDDAGAEREPETVFEFQDPEGTREQFSGWQRNRTGNHL